MNARYKPRANSVGILGQAIICSSDSEIKVRYLFFTAACARKERIKFIAEFGFTEINSRNLAPSNVLFAARAVFCSAAYKSQTNCEHQ